MIYNLDAPKTLLDSALAQARADCLKSRKEYEVANSIANVEALKAHSAYASYEVRMYMLSLLVTESKKGAR